ncbi:MAG: TatD family hydrolase [Bacteroidales bacterium]|nr:TatD family hydrolase [Bacteroidales bacterium]MCK5338451.1 TatD family hydrolase [Bacteroidales bacterium]
MILIDTHTHLYLNAFDDDREAMVERAIASGVKYMFLPNIDSGSVSGMNALCERFPENCFPLMGLHPTSVKENFRDELAQVEKLLDEQIYYGVGETGIDLYWDKTYYREQVEAFNRQIDLALEHELPLVIHARESFTEIFRVLENRDISGLRGVFHCFTGKLEEAERAIKLGFMLGIGGVLTYKNSGLDHVVAELGTEHLILETDAPYLPPVPHRGKRNESAYIIHVADKLAEVLGSTAKKVAETTTRNACTLFNLNI